MGHPDSRPVDLHTCEVAYQAWLSLRAATRTWSNWSGHNTRLVSAGVEAAAPYIRADERARIADVIDAVECCDNPKCERAAVIDAVADWLRAGTNRLDDVLRELVTGR